ncbi:MAG: Uncharacterized protein K0R12_1143 [Gammaproteobacteria bacterium]|jgi:hypothetical protein|nr:Uncharacterized protein [Gammaproteobacteria bacterium]
MAATVDELTIQYEEDGIITTKQLDKIVLTKGAWATLMYKYQDWEKQKQAYSPYRYSIRRYQKRNGEYRQQSKFNISSSEQAVKIIEILSNWLKEDGQKAE